MPDQTRRNLLLGLVTGAASGIAGRAVGADHKKLSVARWREIIGQSDKGADGQRTFSWSDALMRTDIVAAEVSTRGDVALVTTRPLGAKGVHFGNTRPTVVKRGELWLCNADLSSRSKLDLDGRWVWAPAFSPCGMRLAALTTGGDGRVGLAVWDVASRQSRLHDSVNIDIYARFRTVDHAELGPPAFAQSPLQFIWAGENRLLVLAAGEEHTQFDLAGPSSEATYRRLRNRAFSGEASVRTWSPQGETCFVDRRLMCLEPTTGATSLLYAGDIRGVSLSGDERWVAILRADRHVAIDPTARQEAPLRYSSTADDPMVSCSLACVRLNDGSSFEVPGFTTVGNVMPSCLPVWSLDSRRVAVASRLSYSSAVSTGDDACWEVDVDTRIIRRWQAVSAADAEFLAALVVANGAADVEQVILDRQPLASPPMGIGGQIKARSWVLGATTVAKWVGNSLSLVQGADETLLTDTCSTVATPVALSDGGHLIVTLRMNGGFEVISIIGGHRQTRLIDLPADATLLCAAGNGRVLCKQDADDGSKVYISEPGKPTVASPFVLNRYLADVRRPHARQVVRLTSEGKHLSGILLTPTNKPAGEKSPVILWAYPDSVPTLGGWMTKVNDPSAVWYPFQYLLAQGFAVFQAPLPMADRPDEADPLDYVANLITPWLDVLDQQPEVQAGQYGFWGHSNAGYAALALEATTNRFKAIAAASTFPDLAATVYSISLPNQALNCAGDLIQATRFYYEAADQPYRVGGSIWQNSERWVRNSVVFRMERAVTPVLLMVGEYDSAPRAMEEVYSVLYGKGVPVELAYYWGEGHVIMSPGNVHDLWTRSEGFFRRYLLSGQEQEN